jgi:hypothetical protein
MVRVGNAIFGERPVRGEHSCTTIDCTNTE